MLVTLLLRLNFSSSFCVHKLETLSSDVTTLYFCSIKFLFVNRKKLLAAICGNGLGSIDPGKVFTIIKYLIIAKYREVRIIVQKGFNQA